MIRSIVHTVALSLSTGSRTFWVLRQLQKDFIRSVEIDQLLSGGLLGLYFAEKVDPGFFQVSDFSVDIVDLKHQVAEPHVVCFI